MVNLRRETALLPIDRFKNDYQRGKVQPPPFINWPNKRLTLWEHLLNLVRSNCNHEKSDYFHLIYLICQFFLVQIPEDECVNLNFSNYKKITERSKFFEPGRYKATILHARTETLTFCGKSRGIYNPNLLCINSQLCESDLPVDHPFQNLTRDTDIFGTSQITLSCL